MPLDPGMMDDARSSSSERQAGRHIAIGLHGKRLVDEYCPEWGLCGATYAAGRAAQPYQRLEQESGDTFRSIKGWTHPPREELKDPEVLVAVGDGVRFAIELKWGAVPRSKRGDVHISPEERESMQGLFRRPAGPASAPASGCRETVPATLRPCSAGPTLPGSS